MLKEIKIEELLHSKSFVILDVRSPGEYSKGHIPAAINLPLFTDEERSTIGTTYKHSGKEDAMIEGLSFAQSKLVQLVSDAKKIAEGREIIVHCWRGGKRSSSVAWLFDNAGLKVSVLKDGYKSYRRFMQDYFQYSKHRLIILGGRTGCSKTALLKHLKDSGECVIDLEDLAHHKGSAFGWIGEEKQKTNEQFENSLFHALYEIEEGHQVVWLENESRTIGSNYIPETFWRRMKNSPLINIQRDLSLRLEHLVECYSETQADDLILSFKKIETRIGHEATQTAIDLINLSKLKEAAAIALRYYDRCYDYNFQNNKSENIVNINFQDKPLHQISSELINLVREKFNN